MSGVDAMGGEPGAGAGRTAIELDEVTFRYAGAPAPSVESLSLAVEAGACVVLCGQSGSGKTTVARLVNGLAPRFYEGELTGSVRVGEREACRIPPEELARTVGSVFQDPRSQFFTTDTASEVAFACENRGMPREEMLDRVLDASETTGALGLLGRSIFALSSGEKQRVAVASACACSPAVLVLDEPSANLDPAATAQLGEALARLKARGCTLLVAEHRCGYLADVLDRVVLMRDGRIAAELSREEALSLDPSRLSELELRCPYPAALPVPDAGTPAPGAAAASASAAGVSTEGAFEVEDLSFSYKRGVPVFEGVSFSMRPGEVVALVGGNGAGKSTMAGVLCGLRAQRGGAVRLDGRTLSARQRRAVSAYVMQDADYQLFAESVREELRLGAQDDGMLDACIGKVCAELGLAGLEERHPASLSGGQKQRVTIGAAVTKGARLVFLDEPTSGLDGGSMRRVAGLVRDLAGQGRTVLVITHDYEFVLACCTRVLRLDGGRLQADVPVRAERTADVRRAFFG